METTLKNITLAIATSMGWWWVIITLVFIRTAWHVLNVYDPWVVVEPKITLVMALFLLGIVLPFILIGVCILWVKLIKRNS